MSLVLFTFVYIKLPAQHVHHLQQFASECSSAAPVLVFPSACGIPVIFSSMAASDVPETAISGPQVVEYISINHNEVPQQQPSDGVTISAVTPREQQHFIPTGTAAPPDYGGESTHQWIPAGDFSNPINPEAASGWLAMPYSSTASKMDHQVLLSKAASLSWSTHIMQSGEYDHQTTSVKEWISSFRNLRIRRPLPWSSEAYQHLPTEHEPSLARDEHPTQMQQVLSSSSLKELQRQGSIISGNKWSEAYIWCSIKDAGDFVLGSIRPTRATSKATMASTLWHAHRDATFALTSAYYHSSMLPT
eukprot:298625-Amphidinium_carterae.2